MSVNQVRVIYALFSVFMLLFLSHCSRQPVPQSGDCQQDITVASPGFGDVFGRNDAQGEIAAKVGDTIITIDAVREEVIRRDPGLTLETLDIDDAGFQNILKDLIDQRLLALAAIENNLHMHQSAREKLAAAYERILGNVLVEEVTAKKVTDTTIKRVYIEQLDLVPPVTEIRARHILIDTRDEAEDLWTLLNEGSDFTQLALRLSQDPATRFEGGDLGYFTLDGIIPEFSRLANSMQVGDISQPFQTQFGWHVMEVLDKRIQSVPSLTDMRPDIARFLTSKSLNDLVSDLEKKFSVEIISHDDEDRDMETRDDNVP